MYGVTNYRAAVNDFVTVGFAAGRQGNPTGAHCVP
jgi:hypothetical protein